MENFNFFSKNLKTWLFAHDSNYAALGEKLNLTGVTIGKWINENRPPKGPTLVVVCQIIGIDQEDMLHKDLTYQILQEAKYLDELVADGDDEARNYAINGQVKRLTTHLLHVQDQLKALLMEGEKVLESAK